MKSRIIEVLGEEEVLLPSLIADGLRANDRAKARLSVLQAAAGHARNPDAVILPLDAECRAAGIAPAPVESLVRQAESLPEGRVTAPGLGALFSSVLDDVAAMIRGVAAGDAAAGKEAADRLEALRKAVSPAAPDTFSLPQIALMTDLTGKADSAHRLVMDLHKALNRLAAAHAEETVAGARCYGVTGTDRPAIEAFMRGVDATRALKFGHPGLGTVAIGAAGRLTIQNDIGETDAHVVVIAVEPEAVTITYSDVHRARARFLTRLLADFPMQWSGLDRRSAAGLSGGEHGAEDVFYLLTGRLAETGASRRAAFLEAVGASLVFLIDWNRARKLLDDWVGDDDATDILLWAARHRAGHRAFLELGGATLLADAVRQSAEGRIGFGDRLTDVLGRKPAVSFLRSVLEIAADSLLHGGSVRLARDRIGLELVRHLQHVDAGLLDVVIRQAGLAREIAAALVQFVAARRTGRSFDQAALGAQARRIEQKGDRIVMAARSEITRLGADPGLRRLTDAAEATIDELEEAAFIASVLPEGLPGGLPEAVLAPLARLCAVSVEGAEAVVTGVCAVSEIPQGKRVDSEDALKAVGRLVDVEHEGDSAERAVTGLVLRGEYDLRAGLSALELARALERTTDRLEQAGRALNDYAFAEFSR